MSTAVNIDNVSIVFGDRPKRALPLMDEGKDRAEIQTATDQVLGVHNCNLEVQQGEIHVLMGLSGSGKSTLLRAVNGLNPVVRGKVEVNDGDRMVDVTHCDAATLRRIRMHNVAMVFQQFGLLPWRSVRENVGLGLELSGMKGKEARDRVEEQLALVGLADWADNKVSELSGGMQQRVGLARAFATQAPILLMDEPFSALDPLIRTKLQDELLELQERLKRTILFVSHDLDEAFKLGNHISIMEGGRIVQSGAPQDIFTDPRNEYVAEFVQHMNPLGVLRARDLMTPLTTSPSRTIEADSLVRDGFDTLLGSDAPVGVTENGQLVGQLGKDDVLRGLSPTE
ncbi:choline ABC transporter ATP-binding protein [Salipiger bermudensis]|uniref:ABC glycine betaine/L-proline tranporter, ATPase subunit, ProV n=1 Tax=Salipiger bermudensis (strain DSM 26914 / JCM 13377 / KCTC 12554 / HTCC2601) TaxID=314265 RepID=Q0FTQ1_SALBH|nr:choline ABC transporter ATP-binding protein [Salipiger bermudensis]MAE89409.1 choline ABC transporter ATP-binding protein [Pelagibaca sp.]MBR9890702.1 choline ABC transporter ATP-binding protein [bacterium]EAU47698.1 ABC glycine betaine/L-proline tranporter, ATPase subunit, ProV [Salipiger bermudensis HTCC2601]MBN9677755.1 choline ABC transporter ATP-binding protein [Salipiger bermudensis]MCA1287024.1 choline ABC transporter ATP-binding protein [Salipiger bermudensis]